MKIPDGVCLTRPQPRRSAYLSHSHFQSDAVPRVPAHSPPTLHPLSVDEEAAVRENGSFMFHASSFSETEFGDKSTAQLQVEHSDQRTVEPSTSLVACRQNPESATFADNRIHKNQEFYRPHDHPLPPSSSAIKRPQADTQECVGSHGGQAQAPRAVDLASHSVQMEVIQMRDELRRFHDLKLHHKQLEAQLTARMRQGDNETVAEV